jgi:hypothetical protein
MLVQESNLPFSKHIFWDVSPKDLDLDKYPVYFIDRVLERGSWTDWQLIRDYYGLNKIKEVAMNLRCMRKNALSFVATMTDIPETQFRCYTHIHSPNTLWEY